MDFAGALEAVEAGALPVVEFGCYCRLCRGFGGGRGWGLASGRVWVLLVDVVYTERVGTIPNFPTDAIDTKKEQK